MMETLQEGFMTKEEKQVFEFLLMIMQCLQTDTIADGIMEIRLKAKEGGYLH